MWEGNDSTLLLTESADYVLLIDGSGTTIQNMRFQKAVGAVGAGIKVSGIRNRIDNVFSQDAIWTKFIHMIDCWDSVFTRVRIDNDVTSGTGDIFYLDYSVNNSITDCNLQYCEHAIFASALPKPVGSTRSEGLSVVACVTSLCNKAISCDAITSLNIAACVFDFNVAGGIFLANGQMATITGNWIANQAVSTGGYIGVSVAVSFDNATVTSNTFVGNADVGFAVAANGTNIKVIGNHVKSMPAGGINGAKGYYFGNTTDGVSSKPTGDGVFELAGARIITGGLTDDGDHSFQGGLGYVAGSKTFSGQVKRTGIREYVSVNSTGAALVPSAYGDVPIFGEIFVHEKGTTNYIRATFYKSSAAAAAAVVTLASSVISITAVNPAGTVAISGETTTADLRFQAKSSEANNAV